MTREASLERFDGLPGAVQGVIACDVMRELAVSPGVGFAELMRRAMERWEFCAEGLSVEDQEKAAGAILTTKPWWIGLSAGAGN